MSVASGCGSGRANGLVRCGFCAQQRAVGFDISRQSNKASSRAVSTRDSGFRESQEDLCRSCGNLDKECSSHASIHSLRFGAVRCRSRGPVPLRRTWDEASSQLGSSAAPTQTSDAGSSPRRNSAPTPPRKPTQFPGRRTGSGEIPQARRHRSRTRIFCTMSAVAGPATTPLRTMAPAARAAVTHVRSDRSRTAARRSRMSLDIRSGGRISPRIPARPGPSRPAVPSSAIAMDVILGPPHIDDGTGRGRSMTLANEIGEKDVASRRGTLEGNLGGESSNCSAVDGMDPAAVRSAPGNTCSV